MPWTSSTSLGLVVENLRFRYGPGESLALDGVSFQLPRGGRLAVVGPSGSGKTTLFNATVRDNLLIARPDATEEELTRAAKAAQLHSFVESLPEGYDSWIGEQGLCLNGGERQRLAIARALLKDAPLLILDEATAHLDSVTEQGVMSALHTLMEGRTTLAITHRLVGLERMDEILVLRAGRVVERGRHEALLDRGGLYRRMWDLHSDILRLDAQ